MRRFLIKTLLFISFIVFAVFIVILIDRNFSNFKVGDNNKMLVVGHSHSECAFNDSLIDGFVNYSHSGESYFYSYIKMRKIIAQNPQLRTLFIEFSNNQIEKHMDQWIWGYKSMIFRFPRYSAFMGFESYKLLLVNNPKCFKESIFPLVKHNINMIFKGLDYTKVIGGYLYIDRNKTDSIVQSFSSKGVEQGVGQSLTANDVPISEKNLEYLRKLISLSKQHGIEVYFVRSPLHSKYPSFQNEPVFQSILASKFSDIEFLDFSHFSLPNSDFGDLEHLNFKGAKVFSKWFAKLLDKGLLDKDNKQKFIDREMEMRRQGL